MPSNSILSIKIFKRNYSGKYLVTLLKFLINPISVGPKPSLIFSHPNVTCCAQTLCRWMLSAHCWCGGYRMTTQHAASQQQVADKLNSGVLVHYLLLRISVQYTPLYRLALLMTIYYDYSEHFSPYSKFTDIVYIPFKYQNLRLFDA